MPEDNLSGRTRAAIGSLALVYRHMLALSEVLRQERIKEARMSTRIRRDVTGRQNERLERTTKGAAALHDEFQRRLDELAAQIIEEVAAESVNGHHPASQTPVVPLTVLKCPNCGAPLNLPTSTLVRCNYCGTKYETTDYMKQLTTTLRPTVSTPSE